MHETLFQVIQTKFNESLLEQNKHNSNSSVGDLCVRQTTNKFINSVYNRHGCNNFSVVENI